jgi:hypothetical protein
MVSACSAIDLSWKSSHVCGFVDHSLGHIWTTARVDCGGTTGYEGSTNVATRADLRHGRQGLHCQSRAVYETALLHLIDTMPPTGQICNSGLALEQSSEHADPHRHLSQVQTNFMTVVFSCRTVVAHSRAGRLSRVMSCGCRGYGTCGDSSSLTHLWCLWGLGGAVL